MTESFETILTGGHPNSLGRTLEVVELILADRNKLEELYQCYFSKDEVVRLRVSNAMKRICKEQPDWLEPYLDRFLDEISKINQASTQWTLAQLFQSLESRMTAEQTAKAKDVVKTNLQNSNDWIVLNHSMQTLSDWSKKDDDLKQWLQPELERLRKDTRKSVAKRAAKLLAK